MQFRRRHEVVVIIAVNPTIMTLNTRGDQIVGFFGVSVDGHRVVVCRDRACQRHVFEFVEVLRAAGAHGAVCGQCRRQFVQEG